MLPATQLPPSIQLPPPAQDLLALELAAFDAARPALLAGGQEGKWALVQADTVVSLWDTCADAVQAGDERFGLTPFLVQQVLREDRPARLSRAFR